MNNIFFPIYIIYELFVMIDRENMIYIKNTYTNDDEFI